MNIQDFYKKLQVHDWTYMFSDDHSVWLRGKEADAELAREAQSIDGGNELMQAFGKHIFSGEAYGTPKAPYPECPK